MFGQLVYFLVEGVRPSESQLYSQVPITTQVLFWTFPPLQCPGSILLYFVLLFYYYSDICFFLSSRLYYYRARVILCVMHTQCMRSTFPQSMLNSLLVFILGCPKARTSNNENRLIEITGVIQYDNFLLTIYTFCFCLFFRFHSRLLQPSSYGFPARGILYVQFILYRPLYFVFKTERERMQFSCALLQKERKRRVFLYSTL